MVQRGRRRPTIEDVARESGVSRATVSRVINGGTWVSDETLARVEKAIKKTGYRLNPHARSLVTQRAGSIALLLIESHDRFFEDPNFSLIMRSAATALAEHDFPLVLLLADHEVEQKRAINFITSGHVDGAMVLSAHRGKQEFLEELIDADIPLISGGVPLGFEDRIVYVQATDQHGAETMTRYLRGDSRRRVAHIAGPQATSGGAARLRGYREVLGDDFDENLVVYGDYNRSGGEDAMRELLARGVKFDAVFVANDMMATGAIAVLQEAGLSVPGDIAVGGFDDAPVALEPEPQLTTIRQPFDRIAEEMVRLLLDMVAGKTVEHMSIETELVIRGSA